MVPENVRMRRYALVGLGATAVHFLVLALLVEAAGIAAPAAAAVGAGSGALVAYVANRRYTFESIAPHRRALPRFLSLAAGGVAFSAALVGLGTGWLRLPYLLPQAVATVLVFVGGHALNRRWSFA
jgi:putative flippase GtrA